MSNVTFLEIEYVLRRQTYEGGCCIMRGWADQTMLVLTTAQGSFGGHFIQRQRWERYMDLKLGLVEKEDEKVEERASMSRK
jgi:hypothetical protein